MVMISLLEVQEKITSIVVRVLTQLLTFSQVLIQRWQIVKTDSPAQSLQISYF